MGEIINKLYKLSKYSVKKEEWEVIEKDLSITDVMILFNSVTKSNTVNVSYSEGEFYRIFLQNE